MRRIVIGVALTVLAFAVATLVLVSGLGDRAGDVPPPTDAPAAVSVTRPGTVLQSVRVYRGPAGKPIRDEFGESDLMIDAGRRVTVIGDPVAVLPDQWVRVFIEADPSAWPGDFYAWMPVAVSSRPVLHVEEPVACPATPTLAGLSPLSPSDRLRCAGSTPLTFEARTGFSSLYAGYAVEPAFFGGRDDLTTTVSLAETGGPTHLAPWPTDVALDVQRAPGVDPLPIDFDLRVTGQFDHPAAHTCRRTSLNPMGAGAPADAGMPPEAHADSVAWCRARFVVTAWTIVNGPERKPVVPGVVQLHRNGGGGNACGGVGMPPLVFHVDLAQADPVWIEAGGIGHVIPTFSDAWHFVTGPDPGVADANGVLIRDGTVVDPDKDLSGHAVCPMGSVVSLH